LTISLAGYTKSGKSSLFNALTEEAVQVDKALFTTLSTTTRMIEFSNRRFLLIDTVGFIDRLPLSLIEAFHSTLEETIFSDLIILVLDLSEPMEKIEKKLDVCNETIDRLGASGIPTITALNKIDLIGEDEINRKLEALRDKVKKPILLSAKCRTNLDLLREQILRILEKYVQAQFSVPLTNRAMPFISWVHGKTEVKKEEFTNDSIQVIFEATPELSEQVRRKVEELNGKFTTNPKTK
jgi:GTP-binding protein HflX